MYLRREEEARLMGMFSIGQFVDPVPGSLEADPRFAKFCAEVTTWLESRIPGRVT